MSEERRRPRTQEERAAAMNELMQDLREQRGASPEAADESGTTTITGKFGDILNRAKEGAQRILGLNKSPKVPEQPVPGETD